MERANTQTYFGGMDRPIAGRRLARPVLAGAVVLIAGLSSAGWVTLHPAKSTVRLQAAKITISTVTSAPFHDFIPVRGEVVPLESIMLDAVQGGRVEEVLAQAGQRVVAGQPLLRLSDPVLELDILARETQVTQQINNQRSQQKSISNARA